MIFWYTHDAYFSICVCVALHRKHDDCLQTNNARGFDTGMLASSDSTVVVKFAKHAMIGRIYMLKLFILPTLLIMTTLQRSMVSYTNSSYYHTVGWSIGVDL